MRTLTLPHDGPGTHALVVAVSVSDDELYDLEARARVLARVNARAAEALDGLHVRDDLPDHDPGGTTDARDDHAEPPVDGRGTTAAA